MDDKESLLEIGVVVLVGRGAAAEELERLGGLDLMPCASWDEDGIAGADFALFAIDLHQAFSFEEVVEFLADLVVVAFGFASDWKSCFGEALALHRSVGEIEMASDDRPVFGGEGLLLTVVLNIHG